MVGIVADAAMLGRLTLYKTPAFLAGALAAVAGGALWAATPDTTLEEVVVTAGFRDSILMSSSGSISVIDAEVIRDRAAQHLEQVLNLAPNVNFASGASRARFVQIRGIGERSQFVDPVDLRRC